MSAATLRAAAAIVTAAAERTGREWWQRIAADLEHLADDMTETDESTEKESTA